MNDNSIELCPICIETPATYFTECCHCYCVNCLSRIKLCAMCRKPLQKAKICVEIKSNKRNRTTENDNLWSIGGEVTLEYTLNSYDLMRLMAGLPGLEYSSN